MNYVRFIARVMLVSIACAQLPVQADWLASVNADLGNLSVEQESLVPVNNTVATAVTNVAKVVNEASNVAQSTVTEELPKISAAQQANLVAKVQEIFKQSTDFVVGLSKEFGSKFTQLTKDHAYFYLAAQGVVGFVVVGGVCYAIYKTGLMNKCSKVMSNYIQKIQQSVTISNPKLVIGTGALATTTSGIALLDYCKPELLGTIASHGKTLVSNVGSWIAQQAGAVAGKLPALPTMQSIVPNSKIVYGVGALAAVGALGALAYKYRAKALENKDKEQNRLVNEAISELGLD